MEVEEISGADGILKRLGPGEREENEGGDEQRHPGWVGLQSGWVQREDERKKRFVSSPAHTSAALAGGPPVHLRLYWCAPALRADAGEGGAGTMEHGEQRERWRGDEARIGWESVRIPRTRKLPVVCVQNRHPLGTFTSSRACPWRLLISVLSAVGANGHRRRRNGREAKAARHAEQEGRGAGCK